MLAYKITTLSTKEEFYIVAKNVEEASNLATKYVDKKYKIASVEFMGEVYEITEECAAQKKLKPYVPDQNEAPKKTKSKKTNASK